MQTIVSPIAAALNPVFTFPRLDRQTGIAYMSGYERVAEKL
jgi:hypothetical protein